MKAESAERTAALIREKGILMEAIRLTEDNFRYGYIDVPLAVVDAMTKEGLYDPAAHTFGEDDADFSNTGICILPSGPTEENEVEIWRTPCGHARLWCPMLHKTCSEGDMVLLTIKDKTFVFINSSDEKIDEELSNENAATAFLSSLA